MKTIKVSIAPDGKPTIETTGFQDSSCKAATKPLEDAFSAKDATVVDKPEAFIPASHENQFGTQL